MDMTCSMLHMGRFVRFFKIHANEIISHANNHTLTMLYPSRVGYFKVLQCRKSGLSLKISWRVKCCNEMVIAGKIFL